MAWAFAEVLSRRATRRDVLDAGIVVVLLSVGLRSREVALLNMGDVRHSEGSATLYCPRLKKKIGVPRDPVVLPDSVGAFLLRFTAALGDRGLATDPGSPLIPNHSGGRMSRTTVWRRWKAVLHRIDAPGGYSPRSARATVASEEFTATGGDLVAVQKRLGHEMGVQNAGGALYYISPALLRGGLHDGMVLVSQKEWSATQVELQQLRQIAQAAQAFAALVTSNLGGGHG